MRNWAHLISLPFLLSGIATSANWNQYSGSRSPVILASSPRRTTFFDNPSNRYSTAGEDFDFDQNFMPQPELPDDYREGAATEETRLPHTPVIYRYYGKRRSRTRASGSIPFILLGPNVDHWKTAGEHLALRGFSVIACERDPLEAEDGGTAKSNQRETSAAGSRWMSDDWWEGEDEEAASMISNVLQASRWSKAILVATDSECVLAIQAAIRLAPEKIAGLVLCGDLKEVHSLLEQSHPDLVQDAGKFAIDAFLHQLLPCPFVIAWDGETTTTEKIFNPSEYDASSTAECLHGNRCFILGGGIAPHRKQPETFAWTLTRFVEGKVAQSVAPSVRRKLFRHVRKERKEGDEVFHGPHLPNGLKRIFSNTVFSGDFFSSGSLVVYGRIIASALLYGSVLKVAIHQYGNFLDGAVNLKTRYDVVKDLKARILSMISGFFVNWGYIPNLFRKEENQEPDPVDFVTALEADDGNFEHGDDTKSIPEDEDIANDEEESKEAIGEDDGEGRTSDEDSQSIQSEGEAGATEAENEETLFDEAIPEEEERQERRPYQPLFFLDRVVALEQAAGETRT